MLPVCHSEPEVSQYMNLTEHITERDMDTWRSFVAQLPPCERFKGPWIMGGAVRRFLLDQDFASADVDYFFSSEAQFSRLHNKLESKYELLQSTKNHTTFDVNSIRVQLVCARYQGSDFKHMDAFDFTICQTAWDGESIWVTPQAYHDMIHKRLSMTDQLPSALGTYMRILKYHKQGYTASYETLKKVIAAAALEYTDPIEGPTDNYGTPVDTPRDINAIIHSFHASRNNAGPVSGVDSY